MLQKLKYLQKLSLKLYTIYKDGAFTQDEYIELIRYLDLKIQNLESQVFSTHLQDTSVFEISSLKQVR